MPDLTNGLNQPEAVLTILTEHLNKFQSYIKILREPTDQRIKDIYYSKCAETVFNDDFQPILSRLATVFIQVLQEGDWANTIPMMKLLDLVFNAHKQVSFSDSISIEEKINPRREALIKHFHNMKIEIPISQLFKKLRNHSIEIENNHPTPQQSKENEAKLQKFFTFRKKWKKKPGGIYLRRSLAKLDELIRKFDSEWPLMDKDILKESTRSPLPDIVALNTQLIEKTPSRKKKTSFSKSKMKNSPKVQTKQLQELPESPPHKSVSDAESNDSFSPLNSEVDDADVEESMKNLREKHLADSKDKSSDSAVKSQNHEDDSLDKRLEMFNHNQQPYQKVEEQHSDEFFNPDNLPPMPLSEEELEFKLKEAKINSRAIDTFDLRTLFTSTKSTQINKVTETLEDRGIQTQPITRSTAVQCYDSRELCVKDTQTDISQFTSTTGGLV